MTASSNNVFDGGDEIADPQATYDLASEDVSQPALVNDIRDRVDGDVRFDTYTRQLYATDASAYEITPIGVVYPKSTDDIAVTMRYCADREIPVLPRGGGTSLAGQAVNEAVVLDFTRHMDEITMVDPQEQRARVEAGTILEELNEALASHELKFAPDPAAGNRSTIGGAIGNNSTGAHSLVYGKTDAYIEECEVVLADGTVATLGEISVTELRERADHDGSLLEQVYAEVIRIIDEESKAVQDRFPDLKRNVSGYNFDVLVDEAETGTVNLARLLAGSEGTLAVVTEAEVSLEPVPETKAVSLLFYESVLNAVTDVQHVLEHEPAAVELIDDVLLGLARETTEFEEAASLIPDEAEAALLVEFYADNDEHGREQTASLLTDRVPETDTEVTPPDDRAVIDESIAFAGLEAHDKADREMFWTLRKAGLPILLSRTSDEKHISFIEDCAIPPEHLPAFVERFQSLLTEKGRDSDAAFYAHAGPGVLHVRPLVNTKARADREDMVAIADQVTDMVVEFGGSVSGEHGDGRARTQWNRKLYGEDLWQTFRDLKTAFDPDWLLNPGNVCGDHDMTEHLRYDDTYEYDAGFDPSLHWDNENGMQGMVELCHGCGGCRGSQETTGGVMCPTYRAADEEITATRGRANLLRQAMSGDLPDDPTDDEFAEEVLDLCIGCKGCKRDCPSGVDVAKLKTEVMHERHQEHGASLRDHLFANFDTLAAIGSTLAPVSNLVQLLPGSDVIAEKTVGIASERSLPEFRRETFQDWFDARGSRISVAEAERKAILFADTYTNYNHPEVGKAAVRVLEAADVHVDVAERTDSGRPALSKGFIEDARDAVEKNIAELEPRVREGWDIVVAEPSDAVMFQSDVLDLCSDKAVELVAENAYGLCEYVDTFRLDENVAWEAPEDSVVYHGHCHQKAEKKDHHAVGVLRRAGYAVDPLDSGCCGMAGTFGYEAEHYSLSQSIGEILFDQIEESNAKVVAAPGASCRTQLNDSRIKPVPKNSSLAGTSLDRDEPPTPIELLAYALPRSPTPSVSSSSQSRYGIELTSRLEYEFTGYSGWFFSL
ncbi:FAD-linked oxidase C-terminal domain-containing protein [Natrinema sp. 1APR25-10V2]|uniref:FAD-binding and (Fe-S)-binding domain-containing protein n=1 Tax=Natrinema sp. 1APR25-10V2 TaxID=2951081 RepID=UPI0028744309|nr:FAD-linked oxidase C-terminal domain-containing protein [Natrinema sp. 1APR25-10V2]MDS0476917.1 FAD-binding protein [Natrinema sp. 1APR25-10V2]